MHVAVDATLVRQGHSGVETAILEWCAALVRAGHCELTFWALADSVFPSYASGNVRTRRVRLPRNSRLLRIAWQHLLFPLALRRTGSDLLFAAGYIAPAAGTLPVVPAVYDLIALRFPELCRRANAWNYRFFLPRTLRRAVRVLVPSTTTGDDVRTQFPAAAAKVRLVPLGVSGRFRPRVDAEREEDVRFTYGLPERFVLFVGQHEPKKNLPGLLAAFARLKERPIPGKPVELVLAGSRGWGCREIDAAVARLGLGDDVVRTGFVAPADLPVLYALADVVAFPSLYEGFGLPPLEAMACGVPTVVGNRGALPETAGDAALLVDPLAPDAIADALTRVLSDDTLHAELIRKGLARARIFTWERTAEQTLAVFREVVGTP